MAQKLVAVDLEVLLSVPCVGTMAAAGSTKAARRKRGSQQKNRTAGRPHHAPQLEPLAGEHRQEARRLCVSASALSKYLKKHPLEHEGEGVEGEGVEGEGDENPWGSLEDEYLRKTLANKASDGRGIILMVSPNI